MSNLYKRGSKYWINITSKSGERIRESTGTSIKKRAQEYLAVRLEEVWRQCKLNDEPRHTWPEAVVSYMDEKGDSLKSDLIFLDEYLREKYLDEIDDKLIQEIIAIRKNSTFQRKPDGQHYKITHETLKKTMAALRAVLRFARDNNKWIKDFPSWILTQPKKEKGKHNSWLDKKSAKRLLNELPPHTESMCRFALATGLRHSNVTTLQWDEIDLKTRRCTIPAHKMKNDEDHSISLNQDAINVLTKELGKHPTSVFTYTGNPIASANTKAWKKALDRAGIVPYFPEKHGETKAACLRYPTMKLNQYKFKAFRWHDLRHTWASWHVQSGTPLAVLQKLGAWKSHSMVLRYAHLSDNYIDPFASNISIEDEEEDEE